MKKKIKKRTPPEHLPCAFDCMFLEVLIHITKKICTRFNMNCPKIKLGLNYTFEDFGCYSLDEETLWVRLQDTSKGIAPKYFEIEEIIDTLVHELAHAKTHQKHGDDLTAHGTTWEYWFREMSDYAKVALFFRRPGRKGK